MISETKALIDRCARCALDSAGPWLRERRGSGPLYVALREEIALGVGRLDDLPFAASFQEACPVESASIRDYLNKLVALPSGGCVLAGIRFKGLDLGQPYVALLGSDRSLTDERTLREASAAVCEAYGVFAPPRVRLRAPEGWSVPGSEADLIVIGAPIRDLHYGPRPARTGRVALREVRDLAFYPRYRRVHDAFREASPLGAEVQPSSEEDMTACLEGGLVCEVFVDDRWAGLMACAPDSEDGLEGVCVYEEILSGEFRGRGLAAAMQRQFIDRLDGAGGAWIFGTIHSKNLASLATARRVGRREVWRYMFLGLV